MMAPRLDPSTDLSYFPTAILRAVLADARERLREGQASGEHARLLEGHRAVIATVRTELSHRATRKEHR